MLIDDIFNRFPLFSPYLRLGVKNENHFLKRALLHSVRRDVAYADTSTFDAVSESGSSRESRETIRFSPSISLVSFQSLQQFDISINDEFLTKMKKC